MSEDSMEYEIRDCIWSDARHTSFECLWEHPDLGKIPFSAHKDDIDPTGKALFAWAVANARIAEPDPDRQLAEVRAAALARIARAATDAKAADITWRGVTWQADARSTQALSARIASGEGATWIASDNSRHALSRADLCALMLAITTRTEAIVLQARTKKDAILAAKTPKDIAKVDTTINPDATDD